MQNELKIDTGLNPEANASNKFECSVTSVTRLGYFREVLATYFITNLAKKIMTFRPIFEKCNFFIKTTTFGAPLFWGGEWAPFMLISGHTERNCSTQRSIVKLLAAVGLLETTKIII